MKQVWVVERKHPSKQFKVSEVFLHFLDAVNCHRMSERSEMIVDNGMKYRVRKYVPEVK